MQAAAAAVDSARTFKWTQYAADAPLMKNHTATSWGASQNNVYVFGGFDGTNNSNQMRQFNTLTGEWSIIQSGGESAPPPQGRNGHSATLVENKIYYIGGWLGVGPLGSADVHAFDLISHLWTKVDTSGSQPGPCNMHTANYLAARNAIFLFRGGDGQSYLNDLHVLDLSTHVWSVPETYGKRPPIRANHSSATCKSNLYIFGGWNGTDRLNDLFVLDTTNMYWREIDCLGIPPTPRAGSTLTCIFHEDKEEGEQHAVLLVFGGSGAQSACFNDLHSFSIKTQTWNRIVSSNAKLLEINPNAEQRRPPSCFSLDNDQLFYQTDNAPEKRAGHTATLVGSGRRIIVLGGSFGPEYRRTAFELDLDPKPDITTLVKPAIERNVVLVQSIADKFDTEEFSDVCFLVEGKKLLAHRVVLSARNEYFRVLLSRAFREHSQMEIPINKVEFAPFYELVKFLYTGRFNFGDAGNGVGFVQDLYIVADQFMCQDLKSECEMELCRRVSNETLESLYHFAQENRADTLGRVCLHFEKWDAS